VKSLLTPASLPKFHQQLHYFRVYELVFQIVTSEELCCHDHHLWQCILDKIVEEELDEVLSKQTMEESKKAVELLDIECCQIYRWCCD
jgi:hypothetical protein